MRVSVIAPAREISVVIGAALGIRLFNEPAGRRRIAAAIVVLLRDHHAPERRLTLRQRLEGSIAAAIFDVNSIDDELGRRSTTGPSSR